MCNGKMPVHIKCYPPEPNFLRVFFICQGQELLSFFIEKLGCADNLYATELTCDFLGKLSNNNFIFPSIV